MESAMKAPRFASVTISLDTLKFKQERPEVRSGHIAYMLDRLLCGEVIAEEELERHGLKITIREAVSPEIVKPAP
jgi:hypothetical protein